MIQTDADPRLKELRKYESILVISGFGVMIFGLWSIIRAGIYFFLNPLNIEDYFGKERAEEMLAAGREEGIQFITENLGTIVTLIIFSSLILDLLLRVYIGMTARAYGRGVKKSRFFVVLSWIMAIALLLSIVARVDDFIRHLVDIIRENADTAYEETGAKGYQAAGVSMFVDITSFLVLTELAISATKVRKLRKKLGIKMRRHYRKDTDILPGPDEGVSSFYGETV